MLYMIFMISFAILTMVLAAVGMTDLVNYLYCLIMIVFFGFLYIGSCIKKE